MRKIGITSAIFVNFSFQFIKFCRAMLCKRGLCRHAVSVCLYVCPSVTFVDSIETNEHVFKIFPSSGSHILVIPYQTLWQYSDGDPLMGALSAGGLRKNRDSGRISGYRIDDWRSANNNRDRPPCSLPHRRPRICESLSRLA